MTPTRSTHASAGTASSRVLSLIPLSARPVWHFKRGHFRTNCAAGMQAVLRTAPLETGAIHCLPHRARLLEANPTPPPPTPPKPFDICVGLINSNTYPRNILHLSCEEIAFTGVWEGQEKKKRERSIEVKCALSPVLNRVDSPSL